MFHAESPGKVYGHSPFGVRIYYSPPMNPADDASTQRHQHILTALRQVPAGRVISYGRLAARAGIARGARLAVAALRLAPDEAALPWHRVVRADGRIGFPPDHPQHAEQVRRLRDEGVVVHNGRIDMTRFALGADEASDWLLPAD